MVELDKRYHVDIQGVGLGEEIRIRLPLPLIDFLKAEPLEARLVMSLGVDAVRLLIVLSPICHLFLILLWWLLARPLEVYLYHKLAPWRFTWEQGFRSRQTLSPGGPTDVAGGGISRIFTLDGGLSWATHMNAQIAVKSSGAGLEKRREGSAFDAASSIV